MAPGFPIVLANGPPDAAGLREVAAAGVNMVRTGIGNWNEPSLDAQIATERARLDAAQAAGLQCWLWLGTLTNLPPGSPAPAERILTRVVRELSPHPALGAWKGHDEPRHPFNAKLSIPAANLVRGRAAVRAIDPRHPIVIVQAPRGTLQGLVAYRPALDIAGADIYPVSYPPGAHSDQRAKDVGVVGDVARWTKQAAGTKPFWLTLQIAWSGVIPTASKPALVPRFPSNVELRFMAYQAIAAGARGLVFFGGHLTDVMSPTDAKSGWNWSFWRQALEPVVRQLSSTALAPALTAGAGRVKVTASTKEVELTTRMTDRFLYVIAVRRGRGTSQVLFSGLPKSMRGGQVLFEYVQDPPPPPLVPTAQKFRSVGVANGAFRDWLGPLDARAYRFAL